MAESSKKALAVAYDAGRALTRVQWAEDTPVDTSLGLHHNPFDRDDQPEEWQAWAKGLRDALELREEEQKNNAKTLAEIEKEIGS